MARSSDDFSNAIRAQLKIIDPDFSAEPLTPERKIIDTVSDVLAESEADQFVLTYQYDIDSKIGTDLDKFVALFGFARQGGSKATGSVTFSVLTAQTTDTLIPVGTSVIVPASSVSPQITFFTTNSVTLFAGTTSVTASIESAEPGTLGNVGAGTIQAIAGSTTTVISGVTNPVATSGGLDLETDAELRVRFKNTIFRNIAGTESQYLAIAVASKYSNKARVIGAASRFIEYVQIPNSLVITSVIPYSKYTYNYNYFLTQNPGTTSEIFFNSGVDYSFSAAVPPQVTVLVPDPARNFVVGSVLLLEHTYCSVNSRNDPTNNILNYVDVYVSGINSQSVNESVLFPGSGNNFVASPSTSAFYTGSYKRAATGATPVVGNRLQLLLWQPVTSLPTQLTINNVTYSLNTDYWLVLDTTVYKGSRRARCGIEWSASAATTIGSGTSFSIPYTFNQLPITLNELMDAHKQITSDVLTHAATQRYFNVNLIVMYSAGFSQATVDSSITLAVIDFFNKLQFGAVIQISDIIEIIHEVSGVDNVRLALASDNVPYGIQEVASDGVTLLGQPYTTDFALQDSDLPVLNLIKTNIRSQNTWTN